MVQFVRLQFKHAYTFISPYQGHNGLISLFIIIYNCFSNFVNVDTLKPRIIRLVSWCILDLRINSQISWLISIWEFFFKFYNILEKSHISKISKEIQYSCSGERCGQWAMMISQKIMFFAYTSSYMQDALKLKESLLSACHNKGYLLYQKEIESNIIIMRTEFSYFFINWIKKAIFIYHYSLVIVFCCVFFWIKYDTYLYFWNELGINMYSFILHMICPN